MSENKPEGSSESQTVTIAELFSGLDLPQMLGQGLTTLLLLEEMLIALVGGGIIREEQAESMLSRTSGEVNRMCQTAMEHSAAGKGYSAADITVISKAANTITGRIRRRLTAHQG